MPQAPCCTWDYYHADIEAIDVLLEGGAFKMWYAGCYVGECAIGFATSADGSVWTRYARNPVLTNLRSTWESSLLTPQVVVSNGMYHMWYVGATSSAQPVEQIGYATSADGINWTETPASPVFRPSPGSWDEFSVAAPALLWEDPYYVLWYAGSRDDTSWSLGRAISTDGQNWTRDSANPLISPQLAWEGRSVYPGSILKQNGEYELFYTGVSSMGQIGRAVSSDGRVWTRSPLEPILSPSPAGSWDGSSVGAGTAALVDGRVHLWYTGFSGFSWNVGLAEEGLYSKQGQFLSEVVDAGSRTALWSRLEWVGGVPSLTQLSVSFRAGNVPVPDESWQTWSGPLDFSPVSPQTRQRYAQVQVNLVSLDGTETPSLEMIRLTANIPPAPVGIAPMDFARSLAITLPWVAVGGGFAFLVERWKARRMVLPQNGGRGRG